MTVRVRDLLNLPFALRVEGDDSVVLAGVNSDSRGIVAGDLFAAIAGGTHDAARFAPDAVARGAAAVLCTRPLGLSVPSLIVDDVRKRLGPIAQRICGEPTRALPTVGITGTNGKTTVTHLLESVLAHAGGKPALLGTIALRGPAGETPAQLTTPEADAIARFAREQRVAGATALLMEVSSHALAQERVGGMQFEVAGFTNLTQDHLDFHGTMDAYGEAKASLFTDYAPKTSVIAVEQPFGRALAERAKGEVLRCSVTPGIDAELRVSSFESGRNGLRAHIETPRGQLVVESPLYGVHNLENVLLTIGCALALGVDPHAAAEALRTAVGAPGRLERVPHPGDVLVLVDYAHTPDALERVIHAVRPMTRGRLLVVCGCGGDRDRSKRAPMGEVAAREADIAVLTSDNPRTEDPSAILADMLVGAERAGAPRRDPEELVSVREGLCVIADRAQAIRAAVAAAQPGDSIILAGKGHENYQIVGKTKLLFDDRVEAARAIAGLGAV
jgi:UDP-N-acetylmuramoyl-L-alanyl-D-glutamate--2,6-diaminopimelate ligase